METAMVITYGVREGSTPPRWSFMKIRFQKTENG